MRLGTHSLNFSAAQDWRKVRRFHANAGLETSRARDCDFQGIVVLGAFDADVDYGDLKLQSGCYRSTLRDTIVMDNALVRDTVALNGVFVDSFACVIGCGKVSKGSRAECLFSNGRTIHVGVEVGGRDLRVFAEMPFQLAVDVATKRHEKELLEQFDVFVESYAEATQSRCLIIASQARIIKCATVTSSFIGHYALIEDSEVVDSTVLSSKDEKTSIKSKSIVRNSVVQWNSTVEDLAFVDGSLLCDTSHVERHGIVMSSVIAPNTSVAEGEVTSSLVGPFVGFHHQALLIASVWPEGKGNVGYGANVGSNHTLKAPDQELFPGEGVFFGLGCCVKFPSNFQKAQYSVIATGVSTLPQCVEMPFALINSPGHNIRELSPAINEISPGWVLKHSVFTVLRNEAKFATRNRSKRTQVEGAVIRREIVESMIGARAQLIAATGKSSISIIGTGEAIYTDKQVPGLGKNYLRETARLEAIEAYSFFIQLFALDSLLSWMEDASLSTNTVPHLISDLPRSTFALELLKREFPTRLPVLDAIKDLVERRRRIVYHAINGKKRDDARGKRIVVDYGLVHSPVELESAVLYAKRMVDETQRRVSRFVAKL